jgi:hypothetical protein
MLPKVTTIATLGNANIVQIGYRSKTGPIRPQIASLLGVCDGFAGKALFRYPQID